MRVFLFGTITTPEKKKRAMAEIGHTQSTDSRYRVPVPQRLRTTSHWSKPHRIRTQPHVHRMHPIIAEQVLDMYPSRIQPDYGRTTRPPAHTHTRTRSGRELAPSHEAGHCLLFRLGAPFPELLLVDHEVAVSPPTHKAQKRTYADGVDIDHRLHWHGHGTRRSSDSDARFQISQGDIFVARRAREMYCRHLSLPNTSDSRAHTELATRRNMCTNVHETPHITLSTAVYGTAGFWPLQN